MASKKRKREGVPEETDTTCDINVFQHNAFQLLEVVEENSINLVVTSPPYPMISMWDDQFRSLIPEIPPIDKWTAENSMEIFQIIHVKFDTLWKQLFRCVKSGGIVTINIGDATRSFDKTFQLFPNAARITMGMISAGFAALPNIYWKKPTNGPNAFLGSGFYPVNAYVTLDCEHILIFRKGEKRSFPVKDPIREASKFTKEERGLWFSQTWQGINGCSQKSVNGRRTAAFPEEIPYRLIRMFSITGDTILDPFIGTGTTAKVASRLNRNCIGIDVDPEYVKIAKESCSLSTVRSCKKK